MRLLPRIVLGAFAGFCFLAGATLVQAATESGVYVEFRASEAADAPVVERWKLYGASHALVIGIDNYTGGWPRLSNAVKDATLVAEALRGRGFEVELLTDVTGAQLREALRRFFAFKGKDPEARLFVWFAGHGNTENGEGYLVPADAPLPGSAEFNYVALHMGDVGSMVRIAKSKHVLAVFDSCFAGTIFSSQRARPPAAITAAVKRPARQFLTSGDADQKVSDDGTFRTLFLRALRGEETADANRDGYLTGTELSFYLEDRVINLTQGVQTPRGGKLRDPKYDQGDFVFLLPNAPGAPRAETPLAETVPAAAPTRTFNDPSPAALDLEFWNAIKDGDDPADYQAYLEAFPQGSFAPLARVRAKRKRDQVAFVPSPELAIETDEFSASFVALTSSNLRAKPTSESDRVGRIARHATVKVTGKVRDRNWYRIDYEGRTAYIFGELIGKIDKGELAAWQGITGSTDRDEIAAFLEDYPDGRFAEPAVEKLAALPAQPIVPPVRRSGSRQLVNVQAIRDIRGQEKPIFTDMLRNALQAIPNAVVVSEPPSDQDDVVVSGSILKLEQRQEANPDYQSAQIATQFFGGLAAIVANVPPSFTVIDVEVLVTAQETATRRSYAESGYANLKIDSRQVNWNQSRFDAVQTAIAQAAKRIVIRLTGGTPTKQVSVGEIRNDPNLKNEIIRFYNRKRVWKGLGSNQRLTQMVKIYDMDLASVSGNVVELTVRYRWEVEDMGTGGSDNGIATVERFGSSFRVLDFR